MATTQYTTGVTIDNLIRVAIPSFCKKGMPISRTAAFETRLALFSQLFLFNLGINSLSGFTTPPVFDDDSIARVGHSIARDLFAPTILDPDDANLFLSLFPGSYDGMTETGMIWNNGGAVATGTVFDGSAVHATGKPLKGINQIIIRDIRMEYTLTVKDSSDPPPADIGAIPDVRNIYESPQITPYIPVGSTSYSETGDFSILLDPTIVVISEYSITGDESTIGDLVNPVPIGVYAGQKQYFYNVYGVFNPNI
jgi:hypothetical protein